MINLPSNPAYEFRYSALPEPVFRDQRLNSRDLRLLSVFYMIAGKTNLVRNKSRKELGGLAGNMAENVVSVITSRLVKLGWLLKNGNGGRSKAACYQLIVPSEFDSLKRKTEKICSEKTRHTLKRDNAENPSQEVTGHSIKPIENHKPTTTSHVVERTIGSSIDGGGGLPDQFMKARQMIRKYGMAGIIPSRLFNGVELPILNEALNQLKIQVTSYSARGIAINSIPGLFVSILKNVKFESNFKKDEITIFNNEQEKLKTTNPKRIMKGDLINFFDALISKASA
ncbi:hypothetical protein [Chromobacterium amazonense]|uniref:hypothetical protein n=1 Tax=Chromobacterium amazonense TaxID=1382803 RepID=UPI0011B29773|nr:hypothetical protein [Chromobacterium amazonense]